MTLNEIMKLDKCNTNNKHTHFQIGQTEHIHKYSSLFDYYYLSRHCTIVHPKLYDYGF